MYGSQGNSGMRNVARPYFNSGKGHAEGIQRLMMFTCYICKIGSLDDVTILLDIAEKLLSFKQCPVANDNANLYI